MEIGLRTVRVQTLDDNLVSTATDSSMTRSALQTQASCIRCACFRSGWVHREVPVAKRIVYRHGVEPVRAHRPTITVSVREGPVPNGRAAPSN